MKLVGQESHVNSAVTFLLIEAGGTDSVSGRTSQQGVTRVSSGVVNIGVDRWTPQPVRRGDSGAVTLVKARAHKGITIRDLEASISFSARQRTRATTGDIADPTEAADKQCGQHQRNNRVRFGPCDRVAWQLCGVTPTSGHPGLSRHGGHRRDAVGVHESVS